MIGKRIATAAIGLPAVIFIIRVFSQEAFFIFMLLVTAIALMEYFHMALPGQSGRARALGMVLGCCVPVAVFLDAHTFTRSLNGLYFFSMGCCALCITALFFYYMFIERSIPDSVNRIAINFCGIFYVGLLLSHVILIRARSDGPSLLLLLISVTWAGDTAAYAVGSLIGRHPLCLHISPKKTIEGAVGSCAVGIITAVACGALLFEKLGIGHCLALGLGINLMNQFGDLTESVIKRACGAKDSGVLLPGHGGMLDRIDSLFFAAPFLFYYMQIIVPAL